MRQGLLAAELLTEHWVVGVRPGGLHEACGWAGLPRNGSDPGPECHVVSPVLLAECSKDDVDPRLSLSLMVVAGGEIDGIREVVPVDEPFRKRVVPPAAFAMR